MSEWQSIILKLNAGVKVIGQIKVKTETQRKFLLKLLLKGQRRERVWLSVLRLLLEWEFNSLPIKKLQNLLSGLQIYVNDQFENHFEYEAKQLNSLALRRVCFTTDKCDTKTIRVLNSFIQYVYSAVEPEQVHCQKFKNQHEYRITILFQFRHTNISLNEFERHQKLKLYVTSGQLTSIVITNNRRQRFSTFLSQCPAIGTAFFNIRFHASTHV